MMRAFVALFLVVFRHRLSTARGQQLHIGKSHSRDAETNNDIQRLEHVTRSLGTMQVNKSFISFL